MKTKDGREMRDFYQICSDCRRACVGDAGVMMTIRWDDVVTHHCAGCALQRYLDNRNSLGDIIEEVIT